jgi:hypothetical protein
VTRPTSSADPRAYRTADADGRPLAVFIDGNGNVWLDVHGELARLEPVAAMRLGGKLGGAGQRSFGSPRLTSAEADRAPIDTRGVVVAYREVADRIARRIAAGEFGERGQLPPSPDLAEWYGVGRGTVDAARRELERRGLVTVTLGLGTFVALARARAGRAGREIFP